MILESIMNLIYNLIDYILIIELPNLPESINYYLQEFINLLGTAYNVVSAFAPVTYMLALFAVVVAVDIAYHTYKLIMWVLRKIPMLGIE